MNIFLFHRDLRTFDNKGLIEATNNGPTACVFIFDPRQIDKNKYFSPRAFSFMVSSLNEVQTEIPVSVFYGHPATILRKLKPKAIYSNRDCTPFAKLRSQEIKDTGIPYFEINDYTLHTIDKSYRKFTPYYDYVKIMPVDKPKAPNMDNIKALHIRSDKLNFTLKPTQNAGRKEGLKLLQIQHPNYISTRDNPSIETTRLSPHLKFGTISCREFYWKHYKNEPLIRQIYWSDYYFQLYDNFPDYFDGACGFARKTYWKSDTQTLTNFRRWCKGKTGVPIVDAAMRQLNQTGYMHNRCRMIVAMYLIFYLRVDWHLGELYFAKNLTDYSPTNNNGGWQWCACAFRIFNPWAQSKKCDPACEYIKKWCQEYKYVENRDIHNWYKKQVRDKYKFSHGVFVSSTQ